MVITKNDLQHIVDDLPEEFDVANVIDKIMLMGKVRQAIDESEAGLGQDWEEFKKEWLAEEP